MKTGLALAIGIAVATPASAQTEGGRFLPQLLAPGWTTNAPSTESPAFDAWPELVLRGDGVVITARNAEMGFTAGEDGTAALNIRSPRMVIQGEDAGSPILALEEVDLMIDPRHSGGCGFLDALREIHVERGEVRFPQGTGFGADLVQLNGLDIEMVPSAECTSEIAISVASSLAGQAGLGSISLAGIAIEGHLPLTAGAAEAMAATAKLSLGIDKISTWHEDGSLAHSTNELKLTADVDPRSSVPIFLVLAQRDFFAPNWNPVTAFMDSWNIGTFLRADIQLDTLTNQLIPAAIVPPASTLPFASAGLSTTSSTLEAGLRLRRGQWDMELESYTAGIGAAQVEMTLEPAHYGREALREADRAGAAASLPSPSARLSTFDLTWTDTGFDDAVATLFGLPGALLAKERLEPSAVSDPARKSALAQTIWFFDKAAEGQPMTVRLSSDSGIDLLNIVEVLSADPLWIASRLDFSRRNNDAPSDAAPQ